MRDIVARDRRTALAGSTILVFAGLLGLTTVTAAEERTAVVSEQQIRQILVLRDVHSDPEQVSGVLVNLSARRVQKVRLQIERSWRRSDERHPGEAADDPGRSAVYTVPGEIPAGGRLPFNYREDTALPQRSDGYFGTAVSVVDLEQAG